MRDEAGRRSIISRILMPESAHAVFDVEQIRSAVSALLDNAIRFSPDGGQIHIRMDSMVEVARLTITDEGPGIPPELRERVFDEFSDVDALHHTGGQRLSLALAREIARAHENNLALVGADPCGTTFCLALPIAGCHERSAVTPSVELAAKPNYQIPPLH